MALYLVVSIFTLIQDDTRSNIQVIVFLIVLILTFISKYVPKFAACRLKRKLKQMLENLNEKWRSRGLEIRFPKSVKKFCLFLTCCCCCDTTDY